MHGNRRPLRVIERVRVPIIAKSLRELPLSIRRNRIVKGQGEVLFLIGTHIVLKNDIAINSLNLEDRVVGPRISLRVQHLKSVLIVGRSW